MADAHARTCIEICPQNISSEPCTLLTKPLSTRPPHHAVGVHPGPSHHVVPHSTPRTTSQCLCPGPPPLPPAGHPPQPRVHREPTAEPRRSQAPHACRACMHKACPSLTPAPPACVARGWRCPLGHFQRLVGVPLGGVGGPVVRDGVSQHRRHRPWRRRRCGKARSVMQLLHTGARAHA